MDEATDEDAEATGPEKPTHLEPPPRSVPTSLRLTVLFGGFQQLGWTFLLIGAALFWGTRQNRYFTSVLYLFLPTATAKGEVLDSYKTGSSEDGGKSGPGTPVYGTRYRFSVDGREYEDVCYETGRYAHGTVTIEYPSGFPSISCVSSFRRMVFSHGAIFMNVFPAVGLLFVGFGLRRGLRAAHLLEHGQIALGTRVDVRPTSTTINKKPVLEYVFQFKADDGQTYTVSERTHTQELADDAQERLLYDPWRPAYAVFLDNLPGSPGIDDGGRLQAPPASRPIVRVLLPGAAVLAHAIGLVLRAA